MEMHLGNTTQITANTYGLINSIRKSPRWTVHYIRALAVVAVINTFLSIALGLCRRSSNRWIVQKGFFAAAALSVSLGTYSIGLMQSSQVKSEMYPVWTVSLFALFNCIDPVTTYSSFDYIGTLLKMVFGICLNCGYVLLMIVSSNSNYTGNTTIVLLSVITFIKGFHRSLSLVQQSTMRKEIQNRIANKSIDFYTGSEEVIVDFPTRSRDCVTLAHIQSTLIFEHRLQFWRDREKELCCMCVAFSLSHKLHCHFLVLDYHAPDYQDYQSFYIWKLYKYKMMKIIETELAFLYDIFFTGNAFHHYYQAKAASFWALASFIGICSVGIAVAVSAATTPTPGAMAMTGHHHGGSTDVLDTTTADLVITFGILVSLALLQLLHLIQCWTSNWAKLAVACAYATEMEKRGQMPYWQGRWLRLKLSIATSINLFEKNLWRNKIGQYSELPEGKLAGKKKGERSYEIKYPKSDSLLGTWSKIIQDGVKGALEEFGLGYVKEVLQDLLGRGINKVGAVSLDEDVKDRIVVFIRTTEELMLKKISNILENKWLSNSYYHPLICLHLPYFHGPGLDGESHGYIYTRCVMMWHVATWYCEQLEQEREKKKQQQQQNQDGLSKAEEGRTGCWGTAAREQPLDNKPDDPKSGSESDTESKRSTRDQNRRVANALSKYCAYLVVSAPELLPGPASEATRAYKHFVSCVEQDLEGSDGYTSDCEVDIHNISNSDVGLRGGVALAKLLLSDYPEILSVDDPWEVLAGFWVRILVYAAPYGDMEAHRQRLTQGGEFITHLWAMFYHLNVREWELPMLRVHDMNTIDEANSMRTGGNRAVVAFFEKYSERSPEHQFAAASRLVNDDVRFYRTTNRDVAMVFKIPGLKFHHTTIIFLNENLKPTIILYGGLFKAYDIACFVWNKCREDREATTEMIDSHSREAGNSPSSSD